MKNYYVYKENN